jgi:dihydrofolate reductase
MQVNLIAAMTLNGVIGVGDKLPWKHMRTDMHRFKELTSNCPVLMGHNTFESLKKYANGKEILPSRRKYVVSNSTIDGGKDTVVMRGTPDQIMGCIRRDNQDSTLWIIGGAQIYETYMPFCDHLYLTTVFTEVESSDPNITRFHFIPSLSLGTINGFRYRIVDFQQVPQDDDNEFESQFITFEKERE